MKNPLSYRVKNAMIIDDTEVDQFIISSLIKAAEFADNIYVHSSAKEALDILKNESQLHLFPEIIFLDIQMPVQNGFEFLEEFSKLKNAQKKNCKIVMLSSSVDFKDIKKAGENSFVNKLLQKPLTLEAITGLKREFGTL